MPKIKNHIFILLSGIIYTVCAQSISGTVKDALLENTITGVTITVMELGKTYISDKNGNYNITGIKPGNYTIRAEARGYLKQVKRVIVSSQNEVGTPDIKCNISLFSISNCADSLTGSMNIRYYFPSHAPITITIYNSDGMKIRKIVDKSRKGGLRKFSWDGKNDTGIFTPFGKYNCRIVCGSMVTNYVLNWNGNPINTENKK